MRISLDPKQWDTSARSYMRDVELRRCWKMGPGIDPHGRKMGPGLDPNG